MEKFISSMKIVNGKVYISKYEIMNAFFQTEEEQNEDMANLLNDMLSVFYNEEHIVERNITIMPFDLNERKNAVEYIQSSMQARA